MAFPSIPDVSSLIDNVQESINEIDIPTPPSMVAVGTFFLGSIGKVIAGLSEPDIFSGVTPTLPFVPPPPVGLPKVPALPKAATPFKLPL